MSRMQSASVELSELPPEIPLIQPGILSDFVGDGGGCMLGEGPSSRRGEARTVAWRILAPRKFPHRRVFCWRSFGDEYSAKYSTVPVKRHRGEPGHTRDTHGTRGRTRTVPVHVCTEHSTQSQHTVVPCRKVRGEDRERPYRVGEGARVCLPGVPCVSRLPPFLTGCPGPPDVFLVRIPTVQIP